MNNNLIKVNDNFGVVTGDKGRISIINKESSDYDLETILIKENEKEEAEAKLNKANKGLKENKSNTIEGIFWDILLIGTEVVLFIGAPKVSLPVLMPLVGIIFKGISIISNGTIIGRYITKKKYSKIIPELKENILKLQNELSEMKEKTKYSSDSLLPNPRSSLRTSDGCILENNKEGVLSVIEYDVNEKTSVKVLKLIR